MNRKTGRRFFYGGQHADVRHQHGVYAHTGKGLGILWKRFEIPIPGKGVDGDIYPFSQAMGIFHPGLEIIQGKIGRGCPEMEPRPAQVDGICAKIKGGF